MMKILNIHQVIQNIKKLKLHYLLAKIVMNII